MKFNFLFLAVLLGSPVQAAVVATMSNEAGGKIVLMDDTIEACDGSYTAYSTSPKNQTIWGCWFVDDEFVHITWKEDNQTRSYPVGDFVMSRKSSAHSDPT